MPEQVSSKAFPRYSFGLAILVSVLIPLKLSLTYIALSPLLLMWALKTWKEERWESALRFVGSPIFSSFLAFIASCLISAFFGIDPIQSLSEIGALLVFFLFALCFFELVKSHSVLPVLLGLVCGQSLAAFHTIFQKAYPNHISRLFIGDVSESGQLAMTLCIALGLILFFRDSSALTARSPRARGWQLWSLLHVSLFVSLGFANSTSASTLLVPTLSLFTLVTVGTAIRYGLRLESEQRWEFFLLVLAFPLLLSALLLNMKRGPWAGVIASILLLLVLRRPKLFVPALLALALVFWGVDPIRSRIESSRDHFFITGGRSQIWEIGFELSSRFPLGIGYSNSEVLRDFSDEIPRNLTHFHSNPINILVETGWIGLACFLWWILSILKCGFQRSDSDAKAILSQSLAAAILAWQLAGLVEYNVGDSEVLFVAFLLVSCLAAISDKTQANPNVIPFPSLRRGGRIDRGQSIDTAESKS